MTMQWVSVIGMFLTGLGVIVGMYLPVVGSPWGSEDDVRKERNLRIRYAAGIVLVLIDPCE